jgi:uncharacterized membrane protein
MSSCDQKNSDRPILFPYGWLAVITLTGFFLRSFLSLHIPLTGDEVGTRLFMEGDYAYILTTFVEPWLSMGVYIAGTKWVGALFGTDPFILRLPVMVAGALAIPFIAGIVRQLGGNGFVALTAALLAAVNPYLVSFGYNLRSYAFLVLFTCAALFFLLKWLSRPGWRDGILCGLSMALALLAHFCALYFIAVLGLLFIWQFGLGAHPDIREKGWLAGSASLAFPAAFFLVAAAATYIPSFAEMMTFKSRWSGESPALASYLPHMAESFFAPGWLVMPSLVTLIGGWIVAAKKTHRAMALLALGTVIPMVMYAAAGSQHFPWGSIRFLIFILPLVLIQLAFALSLLANSSRVRILLLLVIVFSWLPELWSQYQRGISRPWKQAAELIRPWLREHDVVMAPGHERLSLLPFFIHDQWRIVWAGEYIAQKPADTNAGQRMILATINTGFPGHRQAAQLGDIHLTIYEGSNRGIIASNIVRDIQAVFAGGANPDLTALADLSLQLMKPLDWNRDEMLEMQKLYYHSLLQSREGMFMPPAQRKIRFP